MPGLPTGTVTFLFTDIEGSTRLIQALGDARAAEVFEEHRRLLRQSISAGGGHELQDQGDGFLFVFQRAHDAVRAAVEGQRGIDTHPWPEGARLRIRMGLHTGEPVSTPEGYVGVDIHRAARISAAGHGGQILTSEATRALVGRDLLDGVALRDLGEHRLKDLATPERIFQLVLPDLPHEFPPLKSLSVLLNNLPIQATSFVGREREMADVKNLLRTSRLVTLTGVGGCGKTRLALQVAGEVLETFPDGVWLVELAPLSDPGLIPQAVTSVLRIQEEPDQPLLDTLTDVLQTRHLLLILDNCEHLLDASARLADALLRHCANLRFLATSRESLGVAGEAAFRVPSLRLPDDPALHSEQLRDYEATRLFVERAGAALPGFAVSETDAQAISTICQRLDGIPLAIELAAARVKVLTIEQIAERLRDRFRLLTGGSRAALPRQQTLQAAMDWSHGLLTVSERTMLRRVSVFTGGFTLEAAEEICAGQGVEATDVLDLLSQLVDKSLALFREGRYRLLETVRQYGRDRLLEAGEADALRTQHRDFFLAMAEEAEHHRDTSDEIDWLDRLDLEHDNFRAALEWSLERGNGGDAARLAGALGWFWSIRGHSAEGSRWLEEILKRPALPPALRAKALRWAGALTSTLADYLTAVDRWHEALALCRDLDDRIGAAECLGRLGSLAHLLGDDLDRAIALGEEGLGLARSSGDPTIIARSLSRLAWGVTRRDLRKAEALLEESLALARRSSGRVLLAAALLDLTMICVHRGHLRRAAVLGEESLSLCQLLKNESGVASALSALAAVARDQGDLERCARLCEEGLSRARRFGPKAQVPDFLTHLGLGALQQGRNEEAAPLLEEALSLSQTMGQKLSQTYARIGMGLFALHALRDVNQAGTFLEACLVVARESRSSRDVANAIFFLGSLAEHQGDLARAAGHYKESLRLLSDLGSDYIAAPLDGLGSVAVKAGEFARAARLLGAASALRENLGSAIWPMDRPEVERAVTGACAALDEEGFGNAWAHGQAMTMEQIIEYALGEIG